MILTSINSFAVLSPLLQTHALKKTQSIHRCLNQFMISEIGKKRSQKRRKTNFSCHRLMLIYLPGSGMKYSQLYQQTYLFNTCLKVFGSLKTHNSISYTDVQYLNSHLQGKTFSIQYLQKQHICRKRQQSIAYMPYLRSKEFCLACTLGVSGFFKAL